MRYFIIFSLLQVGLVLGQEQPVPKPQPTGVLENPETPPTTTTNTPPANPITDPVPTELVPGVPATLTETNAPPVLPMPRDQFRVILDKDPFRLFIPKPFTNSVLSAPSLLASVRLTGMMKTDDRVKAFFEVRAAGGGSVPKYIALAEGSSSKDTNGLFQIEVQKIDYQNRTVELKQGNVSQTLKMDFVSTTSTNKPRTDFPRPGGFGGPGSFGTPSGSSGSPSFGRPGGSSGSSGGSTGRDPRGSSPTKSDPSPIPTRGKSSKGSKGGSTSLPQKGTVTVAELAFDKFVQTRLVESNVIPTQRETPQGQLSFVPPTDLPKELR